MLLPNNDIQALFTAAIDSGLLGQRSALLQNVNKHVAARMPRAAADNAQLLLDLNQMNEADVLPDGSVPLEAWLSAAVLLTQGTKHSPVFERALAAVRAVTLHRGSGRPKAESRDPTPPGGAGHFLDETPMNFSRPEAQALLALLEGNIRRESDVEGLLDKAQVRKGRIRLEQAPRALWHDVLSAAASQGAARRLVQAIAGDAEWNALKTRLEGLLSDSPPGEVGPGRVDWRASSPVGGMEHLLAARATWVDVHFLAKGMLCARSVARVEAAFGRKSLMGTGFFIAPGLLLTNHHMLFEESGAKADRVELWLDYEAPADGEMRPPRVVTLSKPVIEGMEKHDWATVRVEQPAGLEAPGLSLGSERAVCRGDFVSVIQHPHGLPKKLGIFRNEVRYADQDIVQYFTDTEVGSSGSPVFNDRWEVVALHHRWTQIDGRDGAQEVRNQGIAIGRVMEGLRSRGLLV